MSLFRKKTSETSKKTKSSEEVKLQETHHHRIITAEGWHRKVLGKPSEVVPKKRTY